MEDWFCQTYKLPPNHPLFTGEPAVYWKKQWYLDCLRKRDRALQELQQLRAVLCTDMSQREEIERMAQDVVRQIRAYDGILQEETQVVDAQLRKDEEAGLKGEMPDFIRRRVKRRQEEAARRG